MDGIDKLYQGLSAVYDLGTPEEFRKKIADEEHRKKLYEQVSPNIDLGVADFPAFSQKIDGYLQQPQEKQPSLLQSIGAHNPYPIQPANPLKAETWNIDKQNRERLERIKSATLPLSDEDKQREAEIERLGKEGAFGTPNGISITYDKRTGSPIITRTEDDGAHLYTGVNANQSEIDRLINERPDYMRTPHSEEDIVDNIERAWMTNTENGQKAIADAEQRIRDFIESCQEYFKYTQQAQQITQALQSGQIDEQQAQQYADSAFNELYGEVIMQQVQEEKDAFKQAALADNQDYYLKAKRDLQYAATNKVTADAHKQIDNLLKNESEPSVMQLAHSGGQMMRDPYIHAAQNFLYKAEQRMNDMRLDKYEAGDFSKNVAYDLGGILESTATFGLSDLADRSTVTSIFKKVADAASKAKDPDEIYNNPELVLNDKERAVYTAYTAMISAEMARSLDTSYWADAAKLTADMVPFMLEVGAMNGIFGGINRAAQEGISRGLTRSIVSKLPAGAKKTAAKMFTGAITDIAGAGLYAGESAVMSLALPRTYANMLQNEIDVDYNALKVDNDNLVIGGFDTKSTPEAFMNAWRDQWKEMFTETGGLFNVGANVLFNNPIAKRAFYGIKRSNLGGLIDMFNTGKFFDFAKQVGYHGTYKEWLEEVEGTCWDYAFGDKDAFANFFSRDTQIPMLISFTVPAVLGGGINAGREIKYRMQFKNATNNILNTIKSHGFTDEDFADIKKSLYATPVEDLPATIANMAAALTETEQFGNMYKDYAFYSNKAKYGKLSPEEQQRLDVAAAYLFDSNNAQTEEAKALAAELTKLAYAEVALSAFDKDIANDRRRAYNEAVSFYREQTADIAQEEQAQEQSAPTPYEQIVQDVTRTVNNLAFRNGGELTDDTPVFRVSLNGQEGKQGYIVSGESLPELDATGKMFTNNPLMTIKWDDESVTQHTLNELVLLGVSTAGQRIAQEVEARNDERAVEKIADGEKPVIMTRGNEVLVLFRKGNGILVDEHDQEYVDTQLFQDGWKLTEDQEEQPKSQAPEVQQPKVQEPAAPVVPNIDTMSADEYVRAIVEDRYKGNRTKAQAIISAKLNGAMTDLQVTQKEFDKFQKKGLTSSMNEEQWEAQYDKYEQQIKGLTALVSKLEAANIAVVHYKTQAELQEEAERKAREAAMREQRRQLVEAEAAGDIEAKWQNTKKTVGFAATKTLPNSQKVNGHYILTEAGDVVPSHDPRKNYADSEGYLMENGQNVNDNNYKDPDVQRIALDMAQNYGGQAVEQMPILENKAGRVLSGNNRTISGIIAAENNTDQAYLAALAENAQQYGFTPEQLAEYEHPRLQFVVEDELPFTTGTFAMFNQQEKKTKSSVNRAVANSKMGTEAVRDKMLEIMDQYESLDSFFGSESAAADIVQSLINEGLMTQQEVAGLTETTDKGFKFNQSGKEYVTDMLLGTLFDEETIRMLAGEKSLKQAILRALPSIVENRRLKGYELTSSINSAIKLLYEARKANEGKSTADAFTLYLRQVDAFEGSVKDRYNGFDIILAGEMANGVERTRELLNIYNNSARDEANGQMGFFEPRDIEQIKQDVYDYYAKRNTDIAAALNGAAAAGAQPQSAVPSGTADAGEVRPTQREQLTEYLNGIADEEHKPILFDNSTLVETLRNIGATPDAIAEAQSLVVNGEHIEGFYLNGYVCLDIDNLPDAERARTKYVHERQHDLTRKDIRRVKEVMDVASESELKSLLEKFSNSPFYNKKKHSIVADEFISFAMEEAYKAKDDAELESALRAFGVKDELIDIIKSINNEQRGIEAFAMARRNAPNNHSAESSSRESRADSGAQSGGGLGREGSDTNQQSLRRTEGRGDGVPAAGEVTPGEKTPKSIGESTLNPQGKAPQTPTGSEKAAEIEKVIADFKKLYPDPNVAIFFRNGKTYDIYGEDAVKAAEILGVEPTEKDGMPFVSFPTEDVGTNLRKFIAKGVKVGIASHPAHKPSKGDYQQGDKFMWEGKEAIIKGFTHFGTVIVEVDGSRRELSREQLDDILDYGDYMYHVGEVVTYNGKRAQIVEFASGDPVIQVEGENEKRYVSFSDIERIKKGQEQTKRQGRDAADTEIGGALVDRLEDMGVNVSTDLQANRDALKAAKADKSEAGAIHYYKTPSGQQYGFSYKGKVYLDPTKIDAELPIHEYGHLWAEALRRLNPENWQHVVETIKADKDAWAFVRELRPELTDENEIAEEVIATFSGKNGAEKMRAEYERMHGKDADYKSRWGNIFKNISKAIQDFWKAVGDFLNIKYTSAEQVYDQVLKDFVDNMNPWKRVSDFLRQRDAEYVQAAESGDIKTATNIFYEALKENIGNGITPYMSVGAYNNLKRLAKGVKTRDAALIKEAADLIAPLIPDNAVLIPAPSHSGTATDMLDLAKAIAKITGSEVADVLRSAPRESQYQAKKTTGVPMASKQLGIAVEGEIPADKTPIIIDNVVDSGNTAEACVQAVGKGVVVTLADSAEQYGHAASLKSAAPVLRDKAGKVIPLSKRFEPKGSRYLGRRMYLSSNDPRFAISGTQVIPVTDKTLVGLHNISAEKLRKALKAGGLANPSAAVIDIARQNHHDYGEVSLVLSSNMVENSDGTYAGDAWTPMYPQVEYRQGNQTEKRIKALVKGLPKNLADGIYYRVGEYMDRNRNSSGLEYIFLKNKGEDMPILTNKRRYPDISIEDIYKRLGMEYPGYYDSSSFQAYEQLPEDQLFEFNLWLEKYGREVDIQRVKDKIAELREKGENKAADVLTERYSQPLFFNYYDSIGYRILRDERDAGEENIGETLDAADRKIDELGLRKEFEDWKQQMIDSFGYDEVLFAGWTSDGDRRYVKNTVENASRLMNKQSETNYIDRQSVNETKAMLMDKLRTLSDIRKHKGQLEPDDEKIREAYEQASNGWGQLGIDFRDYTTNEDKTAYGLDDNPFTAIDTALARLQEAMFKRDPIAFLNREYRYSLPADSEFGTRLKEMVKRIKNLPSRYFETKFRRPVYLNEFANAVVPNDLPQDLRAGLESAGLRLFSYDPNTQGSRRDATLEATAGEGIRFSINGRGASTGSSKRSNRDIEALRQFESVRPEIAKEMESIKNNALNDGTFMQAPNGKPTNLDERQWLQVRTRAFKRWFGDWENDPENASKVLDENGEPMVAKHGTPFTFTTFDKSKQQQNDAGWLGRGFYFFTKNDDYAAGYARGGQVINAFLNIKNPYYATYADMEKLAEIDSKEESERFTQGLIDEGYDGVYFDANLNGEWVAFEPNQIKSATENDGSFSEENDDIRFSISNQNNDIFYSNAERAVEGIKQEKATPEQWRAMIEKAGGLKAGEDKWIGLSDWLAQQRPTVTPQEGETRSQYIVRLGEASKKFTISKQDILDYIREHKIQIEEQEYGEYEEDALFLERKDEFKRYYDEAVEAGEEDPNEVAWDRMIEEYGDDFSLGYYAVGDELMRDNDSDYAQWEADSEGRPRNINETRLRYTTWGLENKREIALIVPDIEEWNENDEIHFGDAGEGRAIAWVRFGDAKGVIKPEELLQAEQQYIDFHHRLIAKYGSTYVDSDMSDAELREERDLITKTDQASKDYPEVESKVLVIDEIQSKRHQEGRDKGYVDSEQAKKYDQLRKDLQKADKEYHDYRAVLWNKYKDKYKTKGEMLSELPEDESNKLVELQERYFRLYDEFGELRDNSPATAVPAAPFEKNWHELAMKRILRFAAENGYDKVAWTTGEQQAKRYDIGKEIDHIVKTDENTYEVYPTSGLMMTLEFDENGMYADEYDREYNGKSMSGIFGKDLAKRLKEMPVDETLQGDGLRVGYDGMKGFYDDILPRFMQKYGKKWGVQVGEVTMPNLEEGYQTMHAIDINDAMRESVMEGQPMFSISGRGVNGTIKPQDGETSSQYIARVAETVKNMTPRNTTIDDAIRFSITVNHNSPYLLKKADGSFVDPETGERLGFDHRFMGKGEGGQAHGWGSYFSKNDIEGYRQETTTYKDEPVAADPYSDNAAERALFYKEQEGGTLQAVKFLRELIREEEDADTKREYQESIDALMDVNSWGERRGHHYTVEIPDNDGTNYFEEDQPLTQEQIDRLRKAAKETGIPKFLETISGFLRFAETNPEEYPFRKFYSDITDFQYGYPRETISNFLKDAGFVGIHYDGRRDGECYVIFNPDDAVITDHIRFSINGKKDDENPIAKVATDVWNKYQLDGELETIRDVAEYVEANMPKNEITQPLFDAIDQYRIEEEEDRALYGERGDLEPFEDAILNEIERLYKNVDGVLTKTPDASLQERTDWEKEEDQIRFSIVGSRKKIAELEAGEKIKVFRAAQVIDGKLYPPMAAKQQGQLVKPIELGRWEQSEEHPELAKDGKFKLDKANGSSVVPAAYNPYFHTSRSPLNDQFSSAYDRPNLVTLEVEVPASELTSGYKAEGAKDVVGETSWHSGAVSGKLAKAGEPRKVILSRWDKPLRIVPDAEVAEKIAGMLTGKDIAIPYNVVTPSLRAELEKQGVTISDQPSGTVKKWKTVAEVDKELQEKGYSDESPIRFSVAYHGTGADFDKFLKSKINTGEGSQAFGWGLYFTDAKEIAEDYAKRQARMPKNVKDAYLGEQKLNPVAPETDYDCLAWVLDMNELRNIRTMNPEAARSIVKNTIALKTQELKDRIKFYEGNGATRMVESAREELEYYRRAGELVREIGIPNIEFRGDRNLYTVSIPEDEGNNYFEWNADIGDKLKGQIIDGIVRRMEQIPDYANHPGYAARTVTDFMRPYHVGGVVYLVGTRWLPKEEMSEVLAELGYKGIKYDAGTNFSQGVPEDAKNYVIFNEDDIEITDHIRFSVSNPSTLSRSETVTKALVQQANNNYNIMQSALKKVTADLKGIRAAMRMQSDYDRKVVDALLNLYNTLLQENGVWAQYMPDTTRRIATQIVHAIGKQNITEEVNTIMDHMVHAQAKAAQRQWDKLRQTPIDKINISGVVMQGKVALEGQHALKAMNDALQANMTIEQIEEQINQLMDMEDNATDESLKTQYKGQWIGLTIAAQHLERLQHLQEERQQLNLELQSARSNKALKPAARQQLVDNIKQAMRDNYIEQAEAYTRSTQDLSEYVNTQEGRAKDFIRRQDANRDKIRSYAQRDLEGLATNPNRNHTRGNVARSIWDAFASPIRDLQSLLRLTGLHAPDGEGYLYNHFMRNWMDGADMERTGIVAASKTLDEKIAELTHGKYKTWEEAARKINDASHNMFGITMLNGVDGKDMPVEEEIPLNAGNALYIYAVNKMNDGRMKLNGLNITEEDVQALADKVREQFGQEILDVVDWVQSEFFSQLRNRYNPTHEALFGAPMDAITNYFPLRINANARQQNEDLSEPDTDAARLLAGTSTGAIKRRTRNSLPLDVRNADFFQEVIRHISQMERWNAFAQWNRDANILFSDINFRNRIKGMKGTIYGEGDKLYNYMKDAFRVAIGTYKPKTDTFSEITLNMAKGVTSAKINFRVFTALKQIASFPAFFTYMQDGVFVQSYLRNWLKPHETMKWAKENLPNFEKRVSKRDMGDMRLMQRSTDWQWNKRILEWSSKYGMFFNVFFDTLTCATGARAVYDSHLADYMKKGYSEEDARNRARQDAEQAFNTSQQSSEGAFMSAVQQDRNLVTAALTVFRTSPIQYTRNFFYHTRNLLRKFGEGKREEQIAFRIGQYKNDGLNDEQARKAAEKDYNKSLRQDIVGFVVYGALLNILWRLAGQIPYLLLGDDDDKKKKILEDATTGGALVSPITGLIGGSYIESALDGNGLISSMFAPELPFTQDAKRAEQYLQNNKYAEFASQALSVLMQSGTGFDPLTASDMVSRIVTTLDGEEELEAATQALRVSQALLSIPQSQYEQMLIDRVVSGETDEDAALEDYIRYQKIHTAPLTWWLRGEESDEKAEENAEKRFNKLLTERDKLHNPEDYEE